MVCVLVGAVATVRTGFRSAVLNSIVVRPASIGKAVALLGSRTDVAFTGRAIGTRCVLCGAVLTVLCSRGMVAIGIRSFTAVVAGFGTAMLRSGVVFPITVGVSVVGCTIVYQFITAVAVFVPVAPRPCGAGVVMVAGIALLAISQDKASKEA